MGKSVHAVYMIVCRSEHELVTALQKWVNMGQDIKPLMVAGFKEEHLNFDTLRVVQWQFVPLNNPMYNNSGMLIIDMACDYEQFESMGQYEQEKREAVQDA